MGSFNQKDTVDEFLVRTTLNINSVGFAIPKTSIDFNTEYQYWDSGNTGISKPKIWEILGKIHLKIVILDPKLYHWYFIIFNYISNRPKMKPLIAGSCPKFGWIDDSFYDFVIKGDIRGIYK